MFTFLFSLILFVIGLIGVAFFGSGTGRTADDGMAAASGLVAAKGADDIKSKLFWGFIGFVIFVAIVLGAFYLAKPNNNTSAPSTHESRQTQ